MESSDVFVILDTLKVTLNGNWITRILGVFTDINIARQHIENLKLKNFRWVDNTRFKFSTDTAHVGEIKQIPSNVILTI